MKIFGKIRNAENSYDFSHLQYLSDYAAVNFLDMYPSKCAVMKPESYPGVLKEEFGINDASLFHRKMIADGYLAPSTVEERLETSSLEEIAAIAEDIGLSSSGTKEEILSRLELNVTLKQLAKYLPHKDIYSLTDAGRRYIESHRELLDLYRCRNRYHITYAEYSAGRNANPNALFIDLVWVIINSRFQNYANEFDFSHVQDEYLNMYAFLIDQKRNTDALGALLNYLFMDLNAFDETYQLIQKFKNSGETVPEFLSHAALPQVKINPDVPSEIYGLKDIYDASVAESISHNSVYYYVNTELFLSILNQIFQQTFSLSDTEQMINQKVPAALDHILRSDQI